MKIFIHGEQLLKIQLKFMNKIISKKLSLISKILSGILFWGIIFNLINIYNIQYLYIRAILSFCFLVTIPGLLTMLALKFKKVDFWECSVYIVGLSIAFLMFSGLAINWILPWLHITNKPLSLIPLLSGFDTMLIILGFIAYIRNQSQEFKLKLPKICLLNKVFYILPIIFPLLSIFGATTLNNGGSNLITMFMLGGIAVYIFLIFLLKKYINMNIYPSSILMMSSALLLMGWFRSWYVSGADINLEYHIFQLIKEKQSWSMSIYNNAYNACLSISILPTILSNFLNINDQYIFKLILPLIFSFLPVSLFLLFKKFTSNYLAFISVIFFISQPTFITWWQIPIRQEVALLYFALSILILFNNKVKVLQKNILFIIFSISMIVSHYSTTYISLALFVFTYLLYFIYRFTIRRSFFAFIYGKLNIKANEKLSKIQPNLSGIMVILPIIFAFIWYVQITNISVGLVNFSQDTIGNINKIFNNEIRSEGSSFGSQWNLFNQPPDDTVLFKKYQKDITNKYKNISFINTYSQDKYVNNKTNIIIQEQLPIKIDTTITNLLYLLMELIKKLVKIFILIGVYSFIFIKSRKKEIDTEYIILSLGSLVGIIATIILPFASIDYDVMREYQQSLVFLSLSAVIGGSIIFKFIKKENFKLLSISLLFIIFYLYQSNFIPQIIGGLYPSFQLNNYGDNYNEFFVHSPEIISSAWLNKENYRNEFIYADNRASYKFWLSTTIDINKINNNVFPSVIDKNAYTYSSYTNTFQNIAFISIKSNIISYNFPHEFLNTNKNIIYNNGGSRIYK